MNYIYKAAHFLKYIDTHLIYLYEICVDIYTYIYIDVEEIFQNLQDCCFH